MTRIELEIHEDIITVLSKLKNINDTGIELYVPEGSVIFENILNLKLIKEWSEENGKVVSFDTEDTFGTNLLLQLEDAANVKNEGIEIEENQKLEGIQAKKLDLSRFKILFPKLLKPILLILLILSLIVGGIFASTRYIAKPTAEVRIVVNSVPLTRSVQIKVSSDLETSLEDKVLKGLKVETELEGFKEKETTGEKTVGEKAKGKILIYNNTDEDKEFKKGTTFIYEDEDYEYRSTQNIEVPARSQQDPDPLNPDLVIYVKGKASVEVEATEIGSKYNIDEGEPIVIEDQKQDEFTAEVEEDIDGGKTEKIQVVTEEDTLTLETELKEEVSKSSEERLSKTLSGNNKLIKGSESSVVTEKTFSHKIDEETDKLGLGLKMSASGLTYNEEALNRMLDEMVEGFVPEGFILSDKERSVSVEVLGNSDATILNSQEADLQVTLRTFVVPNVTEQWVKDELAGKDQVEAQKILGTIRSIKTYGLDIKPRIPLFDKVPTDKDRIIVKIERE